MRAIPAAPRAGPAKVLRIARVRSGTILEEKLFEPGQPVRLGREEGCDFAIGGQPLVLFEPIEGEYRLNFTEGMQGRVATAGVVRHLAELRWRSGDRSDAGPRQLRLSEESRGKIAFGDEALLFHFVTPPPPAARPQLPSAARQGLLDSLDWPFTAAVTITFSLFLAMVVMLEQRDWPIAQRMEPPSGTIATLLFEERMPPLEPQEIEAERDDSEPSVAENAAPEDSPVPAPDRARADRAADEPEAGRGSAATDSLARARLVEELGVQVESALLTSLGAGGAFQDALAQGLTFGPAEEVLEQASGVGVATIDSAGRLRPRTGSDGSGHSGRLGTLRRAREIGAPIGEGPAIEERRVSGHAEIREIEETGGGGTGFDPRQLAARIRGRLRTIQRCYEMQLSRNPGLEGRVMAELTVQPAGAVSGIRTLENTTGSVAVAGCVSRGLSGLRFSSGPTGGSITFSFPFIFRPGA
ncbi:MAG: AgmX/PglI C-terminal domain-containing protein [Myxococcales bacterium]|nr:AgmX/PglI C-terminal domain-containing protein [Myxococcales bacterium]